MTSLVLVSFKLTLTFSPGLTVLGLISKDWPQTLQGAMSLLVSSCLPVVLLSLWSESAL